MGDLEDRPQHLMLLLALVRGVLGVLHLVGELEQSVLDVVEAIGRRLAVTRGTEGRHVWRCGVRVGACCEVSLNVVANNKSQIACDVGLIDNPDPKSLLTIRLPPANVGCSEQHCAQVRHWKAGPAQQT
jgi:hypothetical protein